MSEQHHHHHPPSALPSRRAFQPPLRGAGPDAEPLGLASGASDETELFPLSHYVDIVLKHIWTTLLVTLVVFSGVAVYTFRQPKVYEASTSIVIELQRPKVLGNEIQPVVEIAPSDFWNTSQYFETQYKIIKSRALATKVVEKLGLADDPVFLQIDHLKDDPKKFEQALAQRDPVDHLLSLVEVDPALDSRIVVVRARHTKPELAARLADEVALAYQRENVNQKMESTYGAYNWLTNQYQDVKRKLEESDQALYDFKERNDIVSTSLEDRQNIVSQRLADLSQRLTSVRAERIRRAAEVGQVRRLRKRDLSRASVDEVIGNGLIQQLKSNYNSLKQRKAELGQRYLDNHPEILAIDSQLKSVERDLRKEIGTVLEASENRLAVLQNTETGLQEELERAKAEAQRLNQKELGYNKLARENQNNARLYELVLRRLKETDLSRLLRDNNIRILDRALVPEKPVLPRIPVNLALGGVLGILCGLGLAFAREMIDNSIKTQEDVEGHIGLTFLGLIPTMRHDDTGSTNVLDDDDPLYDSELYIHAYPRSTVAECYRTVRTNILFMSPDRPLHRLLVTSASPREGKTTTTANIAAAMAQSNTRVLVVDTDMRRARLHKVFNLHNNCGLSSLILGEASYEEAIQDSTVPNLHILPCGPIPPNPAELLHTDSFLAVMEELDKRYDCVIYDSPPTIAVTDAMILSNLVDGVIFVVQGGQTSKEVARRARARLSAVNAPMLGCVLNNVDLENRRYGQYYYHYYKKYGAYYGEVEGEEERDAA